MRLTNEIREQMICVCIGQTFKERKENLEKERIVFADMLYDYTFGEDEKIAKKLPKHWLRELNAIYIFCEGFNKRYYGHNSELADPCFKLSKPRLEPCIITDQFKLDEKHKFFKAAQQISKTHASIYKEEEDLKISLKQLVYSVTTLSKLKEIWPQGEKFFPGEKVYQNQIVPSKLTQKINNLMGIK